MTNGIKQDEMNMQALAVLSPTYLDEHIHHARSTSELQSMQGVGPPCQHTPLLDDWIGLQKTLLTIDEVAVELLLLADLVAGVQLGVLGDASGDGRRHAVLAVLLAQATLGGGPACMQRGEGLDEQTSLAHQACSSSSSSSRPSSR